MWTRVLAYTICLLAVSGGRRRSSPDPYKEFLAKISSEPELKIPRLHGVEPIVFPVGYGSANFHLPCDFNPKDKGVRLGAYNVSSLANLQHKPYWSRVYNQVVRAWHIPGHDFGEISLLKADADWLQKCEQIIFTSIPELWTERDVMRNQTHPIRLSAVWAKLTNACYINVVATCAPRPQYPQPDAHDVLLNELNANTKMSRYYAFSALMSMTKVPLLYVDGDILFGNVSATFTELERRLNAAAAKEQTIEDLYFGDHDGSNYTYSHVMNSQQLKPLKTAERSLFESDEQSKRMCEVRGCGDEAAERLESERLLLEVGLVDSDSAMEETAELDPRDFEHLHQDSSGGLPLQVASSRKLEPDRKALDKVAMAIALDGACVPGVDVLCSGALYIRPSKVGLYVSEVTKALANYTRSYMGFYTHNYGDQGRMTWMLEEAFDFEPHRLRALCRELLPLVSGCEDEYLIMRRSINLTKVYTSYPILRYPATIALGQNQEEAEAALADGTNEPTDVVVVCPRWMNSIIFEDLYGQVSKLRAKAFLFQCGDIIAHGAGDEEDFQDTKRVRSRLMKRPACVRDWPTEDSNFSAEKFIQEGREVSSIPLKKYTDTYVDE